MASALLMCALACLAAVVVANNGRGMDGPFCRRMQQTASVYALAPDELMDRSQAYGRSVLTPTTTYDDDARISGTTFPTAGLDDMVVGLSMPTALPVETDSRGRVLRQIFLMFDWQNLNDVNFIETDVVLLLVNGRRITYEEEHLQLDCQVATAQCYVQLILDDDAYHLYESEDWKHTELTFVFVDMIHRDVYATTSLLLSRGYTPNVSPLFLEPAMVTANITLDFVPWWITAPFLPATVDGNAAAHEFGTEAFTVTTRALETGPHCLLLRFSSEIRLSKTRRTKYREAWSDGIISVNASLFGQPGMAYLVTDATGERGVGRPVADAVVCALHQSLPACAFSDVTVTLIDNDPTVSTLESMTLVVEAAPSQGCPAAAAFIANNTSDLGVDTSVMKGKAYDTMAATASITRMRSASGTIAGNYSMTTTLPACIKGSSISLNDMVMRSPAFLDWIHAVDLSAMPAYNVDNVDFLMFPQVLRLNSSTFTLYFEIFQDSVQVETLGVISIIDMHGKRSVCAHVSYCSVDGVTWEPQPYTMISVTADGVVLFAKSGIYPPRELDTDIVLPRSSKIASAAIAFLLERSFLSGEYGNLPFWLHPSKDVAAIDDVDKADVVNSKRLLPVVTHGAWGAGLSHAIVGVPTHFIISSSVYWDTCYVRFTDAGLLTPTVSRINATHSRVDFTVLWPGKYRVWIYCASTPIWDAPMPEDWEMYRQDSVFVKTKDGGAIPDYAFNSTRGWVPHFAHNLIRVDNKAIPTDLIVEDDGRSVNCAPCRDVRGPLTMPGQWVHRTSLLRKCPNVLAANNQWFHDLYHWQPGKACTVPLWSHEQVIANFTKPVHFVIFGDSALRGVACSIINWMNDIDADELQKTCTINESEETNAREGFNARTVPTSWDGRVCGFNKGGGGISIDPLDPNAESTSTRGPLTLTYRQFVGMPWPPDISESAAQSLKTPESLYDYVQYIKRRARIEREQNGTYTVFVFNYGLWALLGLDQLSEIDPAVSVLIEKHLNDHTAQVSQVIEAFMSGEDQDTGPLMYATTTPMFMHSSIVMAPHSGNVDLLNRAAIRMIADKWPNVTVFYRFESAYSRNDATNDGIHFFPRKCTCTARPPDSCKPCPNPSLVSNAVDGMAANALLSTAYIRSQLVDQ